MSQMTSNSRIKKLSPLLINQLAAGEVVTRPAAVVKELLENAIDANATHIEVRITQGGMGMIQVIDNGMGIHPDDMVMAITRHATSKVADVANLQGISTLGFRGEALAATAAVSRLTLSSSHDASGIGRQLQVAGVLTQEPKLLPVVQSRGTAVTIKDLYFNVPARRGNLKSIATEFAHIETMVREVALARADVTLLLFHDNKKRLTLAANSEAMASQDAINATASNHNNRYLPMARLEQALGLELTEGAVDISVDLSSLLAQSAQSTAAMTSSSASIQHASISGWLWPTAQPQNHLPKLLYINGRLIKEPIINNQLRQLAASADIAAMGYALHFELPMHWLNVNVHPSKQRIKISPLNNILAHLSHVIANKLKSVEPSSKQNPVLDENGSNSALYHNSYDSGVDNSSEPYTAAKKHQLHSIKHSYQYSQTSPQSASANQALALEQNDNYTGDTFINKTFVKQGFSENDINNNQQIDSDLTSHSSKLALLSRLPNCLEVITDISTIALLTTSLSKDAMTEDNKLDAAPWLLFYSEGQLMVVKEDDWQQAFTHIFASEGDRQHHSALNEGNSPQQSKYHINWQMNHYAQQMSLPDLQAFATDIRAILSRKAITHIDSKQLIGLMLSSAPA